MVNLHVLNLQRPPQLLQEGTLHGDGLDLQVSGISEHVHSRAATIYKAPSGKNGQIALKVVFAPDVRKPHDIKNEIRLLSGLIHPNVCPLLNAYFIDSHYILALPFFQVTLLNILDNPTFIPTPDDGVFTNAARCLIRQMCGALAYLEDEQVAHRDISPSNFLVSEVGHLVLADFGVAYDAEAPGQEGVNNLQFELGTGPYRAPELLFGSRSYNPIASDRWSLGATISSFFTHVGPTMPPSPDSDEPRLSFMASLPSGPIVRSTLFDGGFSDFALIGSMFKIRGTPTLETWPDAKALPDFGKFTYRHFPPADLSSLMPNLPSQDEDRSGPLDLIEGMLQYPFSQRLGAKQALDHPWLSSSTPSSVKMSAEAMKWFL